MSVPTPPSQQVVSTLVVQQCLRLAKSRGLDTERFLRNAGLTREQVGAAQAQLPFLPLQQQLRAIIELADEPLIGLRASTLINMATIGVLGYVMQTSPTLRNLIETVIRFEGLLSNVCRTSLRVEGTTAVWALESFISDELVARHATECTLGTWATLLDLVRGEKPGALLQGVRLRHAAPKDPALLRDYEDFFRCSVRFNQAESALLAAASALDQPMALADPALHDTLEEHARLQLSRRSSGPSLTDQVKGAVRSRLMQHAAPTREEIAEALAMSGRTLHRKLQEAGTSFRAVLDGQRLALARDYLRDSALTVEAIAQQLGFQESQSFIRWFRQMAGLTPGEFRQQGQRTAT